MMMNGPPELLAGRFSFAQNRQHSKSDQQRKGPRMPEKVKPVNRLHTPRPTCYPANFADDVRLRKERGKTEHKTNEHHKAPVIDECLNFLNG